MLPIERVSRLGVGGFESEPEKMKAWHEYHSIFGKMQAGYRNQDIDPEVASATVPIDALVAPLRLLWTLKLGTVPKHYRYSEARTNLFRFISM